MEKILSGYCRALDGSRMVLVDSEDGCGGCAWPDCPHAVECQIAKQIQEFLTSAEAAK